MMNEEKMMNETKKDRKPLNPNNVSSGEAAKALLANTGKGLCWIGRWGKKVGKAIASNPDKD